MKVAGLAEPALVSDFDNLWKSEAECEKAVLLLNLPSAGEAEALAQPLRPSMSNPTALSAMRQENLLTLRSTIETIKQEAKAEGSTRSIARALDLIELVLRAQEDRLKAMDVVAAALKALSEKV